MRLVLHLLRRGLQQLQWQLPEMPTGFGQRFDQGARRILPFGLSLLFLFGGVVTWPLPHIGAIAPSLGLAAIYYWALHRPDLLTPLGVFFLGLLNDGMNYLPFGLSAFIFVAVYQLALSQRRYFVGQVFYMLWAGFGLVAVLAMVVQWLGLSIFGDNPVPFGLVFVQTLLSVVIFPAPAWILIHIQRLFLSQG